MSKPLTIVEFMQMFPNDDACLEHLFKARFGADYVCERCGEAGKWKRLSKMPAYTCQCGEHIHPMVGTPFYRSHTPLQKWFYAMYLFTTTRHGVPAKELQRQLSVNYKTAWRMGHEIRRYLAIVDGDPPLDGEVEVDETYVGGRTHGKRGRGAKGKSIVLGMQDRDGALKADVISDVSRVTLWRAIVESVSKGSVIHTDELRAYKGLDIIGYVHKTVRHSLEEYATKDGCHVNHIEAFFSLLKRTIKGTHVHVSGRHLAKYVAEFEFRWNLRQRPEEMFPRLLKHLAT